MKASGGGSVAIGSPLNIRTALKFAKLDFSAFAGKGGGTGTKDRSTPAPATLPSTFRFSRGWTRGPNVAADEIGYAKVFAGPVRTTLVVKGGAANLTVPQSPFYGGTLAAKLTADGSGDVPAIKLDMAIAGAAAAPLLHDAARFDR